MNFALFPHEEGLSFLDFFPFPIPFILSLCFKVFYYSFLLYPLALFINQKPEPALKQLALKFILKTLISPNTAPTQKLSLNQVLFLPPRPHGAFKTTIFIAFPYNLKGLISAVTLTSPLKKIFIKGPQRLMKKPFNTFWI